MVSETDGRNLYSGDQEGKMDGHNVFLPIRLSTTLILLSLVHGDTGVNIN